MPTPVHKTVSRPMVDDNLYPILVDDIERERVRERGEIYTAVDRLGSGSPLLALEDLCNLISGWERVIPLHYFIKRLNRARVQSNARFPSDSNPRSSYELDGILSKLGDKNFVAFKTIDGREFLSDISILYDRRIPFSRGILRVWIENKENNYMDVII